MISFGYIESWILEKISEDVERVFILPVKIKEGQINLSDFFEYSRNQYNANGLLKVIEQRFSNPASKTLSVFNVDLFIPILTYIFGQAYLGGKCGIASLFRLGNEKYGINVDERIYLDRIRKEIIHELGHMFGLYHCLNPYCVMRSSTYVEDIDQKNWTLCSKCRKNI